MTYAWVMQMTRRRILRLFALLLLTAARAQADTYPRQPGVDIVHYAFKLTLRDDTDAIDGEAAVTFRVVKDGVASFTPVRTGIASETMIEVFGTLKPGDQVVSGPYKALRELKPGAKVKP